MVKRFLGGMIAILCAYALTAWGISGFAGFSTDQIKGIYFWGIIATLNVVLAFLIINFTIERDQKEFARYFLGGMALRLVLMLAAIMIVLKKSSVDDFVFIGSLFILYFLYQIWEVFIVNSYFKKG